LSLILVVIICGFWPLRLLRFYAGFCLLYLAWITLFLYASCSALFGHFPSTLDRTSRWWLVAVVPLALLSMQLLGMALTRASGFKSFSVPSTSMENTIRAGDLLVADMWYYRAQAPAHQDVILFARNGTVWVKRVIAIGGDTIEGRDGTVTINHLVVVEPFVQHTESVRIDEMNNFEPVDVPHGKYFVIGDNRDVSLDSRPTTRGEGLGLVDRKSIVGKPLYVIASTRQGKPIQ